MQNLLRPLDDEADRIIQEVIERGPNYILDPNSTRARIEAVYAQLPDEAKAGNILYKLAQLTGAPLPPRATPAEAHVDKLTKLIPLKVADERNRVDLTPRTLELPADFDTKGGEVSVNGETIKLPVEYYRGMQDLGLVEVIEAMGLDGETKVKLLSKILPSIEKDGSSVTLTTPSGVPMLRITPDECIDLKKSQFGVSNVSVIAALYAVRRTSVLSPEEKTDIENRLVSFETNKAESGGNIITMVMIPNGTMFRHVTGAQGLQEKPKGYWNYERPRGLITPLLIEEFLRVAPDSVYRDGEMRKKEDGTLSFGDARRTTEFVSMSPDGKNVTMETGPYSNAVKYLHDAVQILKRPGHIHGIDDFGPRERFRQSLLNGILNSIEMRVAEPK